MVSKGNPKGSCGNLSGDLMSATCPTRRVLDLIADKWTTLVIYLLSDGTKRYGELQKAIGGISQKMLTQTLRRLEEDGLVKRTVFPVVPPRTEYELTPLGRTLQEPTDVRPSGRRQSRTERGYAWRVAEKNSAGRPAAWASAKAQARPIPREAPVTRATLFASPIPLASRYPLLIAPYP